MTEKKAQWIEQLKKRPWLWASALVFVFLLLLFSFFLTKQSADSVIPAVVDKTMQTIDVGEDYWIYQKEQTIYRLNGKGVQQYQVEVPQNAQIAASKGRLILLEPKKRWMIYNAQGQAQSYPALDVLKIQCMPDQIFLFTEDRIRCLSYDGELQWVQYVQGSPYAIQNRENSWAVLSTTTETSSLEGDLELDPLYVEDATPGEHSLLTVLEQGTATLQLSNPSLWQSVQWLDDAHLAAVDEHSVFLFKRSEAEEGNWTLQARYLRGQEGAYAVSSEGIVIDELGQIVRYALDGKREVLGSWQDPIRYLFWVQGTVVALGEKGLAQGSQQLGQVRSTQTIFSAFFKEDQLYLLFPDGMHTWKVH